jgi:transformation/transcription domain-associated protein
MTYIFQLTIHLALMGFAEFVLHLTRMNPDMMYLHQDCGYLNISYFKFDIDDQTGKLHHVFVLTLKFIYSKSDRLLKLK